MQSSQISKLQGQANYASWAFGIEMLLTEHDLWDCINEDFSRDTELGKNRHAKARANICLTVAEKIIPIVASCITARETWLVLKGIRRFGLNPTVKSIA